jgi:predicted Zn-dependent protease
VRYKHEIDVAEPGATSREGLAAARERLEAALGRSPDDPNLALRLSELESQSGDAERALKRLDRVLELEPRSSELLVQRGRLLDALHRSGEAQESILEAIRMDPFNLPSYTALVEVVRDSGAFALGSSVLTGALAKNPGSAYIRVAFADLLFFHGDREKAERECMAVLSMEPANPDALGRLVSLYEADGLKEKAFALMREARATQPMNCDNNLELAKIYDARGEEEQAVECLRAAAQSGPATAQAHIFIARHLGKAKQHLEEMVELARARRIAILTGDGDLALKVSETIREVGRD